MGFKVEIKKKKKWKKVKIKHLRYEECFSVSAPISHEMQHAVLLSSSRIFVFFELRLL